MAVNAKELEKAAQAKLDGKSSLLSLGFSDDEEAFRYSEYQAIKDGKVGPSTDLYVESVKSENYEEVFASYFSAVRLVHKLRETRALAGFTRILPPDGSLASPSNLLN